MWKKILWIVGTVLVLLLVYGIWKIVYFFLFKTCGGGSGHC